MVLTCAETLSGIRKELVRPCSLDSCQASVWRVEVIVNFRICTVVSDRFSFSPCYKLSREGILSKTFSGITVSSFFSSNSSQIISGSMDVTAKSKADNELLPPFANNWSSDLYITLIVSFHNNICKYL